ncbi:synaptosomal-associated protein 29-like [Penaeus japonicus]|uniref:synaptosomal-associated protein 29-like n=1 Tax=Penaeus japonicus TaxID=27405 RepID=UPI001C70DBA9|nr:synaptosomal-associated protein 29-like [Penaeus japonicus]
MARRDMVYSLNSNKPAFSMLDDDDIASEFLNTSSATYLAADKLPPGPEQQAANEAEIRRQELLKQMRQVEERTLDSAKRSIGMLHESEKVGIETAEELVKQREQLVNTERRIDDVNNTLKDTQKNINSIKSVFSSLKNWWTTPKQTNEKDGKATTPTSPTSPTSPTTQDPPAVTTNPNLGMAYERSQMSVSTMKTGTHPAMRLKGLEEEEEMEPDYRDFRSNMARVNKELDSDLDTMSAGLSRLKGLAIGLGTEIEDQNVILDRITGKANNADLTVVAQNAQMKKIIKK